MTNWNDHRNDGQAWDMLTNYADPLGDWTEEDVREQGRVWDRAGEPCEPGQVEAAIRYMQRCREGK